MPGEKRFTFICGADDYLVCRLAKQRYQALAAEVSDEFSREIIDGTAAKVDDVIAVVRRFRESVQTLGLFGGRRVVWLKDVSFLADTQTGRAEGTLEQVAALQDLLGAISPEEVGVIVSASPVDRRRGFPKWCESHSEYHWIGGDAREGDTTGHEQLVLTEAKEQEVSIEPGAVSLLVARIGPNSRLLVEEVRKLATYAGESRTITEEDVAELTPNVAEGSFFEAAEAFFSGDLKWTLAALQRHFFAGESARPILTTLQNRNRLLLQTRALLDCGSVKLGPRGFDKAGFDRTAARLGPRFGAEPEKSSFNLFTQNPWYLSKLLGGVALPSLRRLIDWQQEFTRSFEEIIERPHEEEEVLRELAVRCLT